MADLPDIPCAEELLELMHVLESIRQDAAILSPPAVAMQAEHGQMIVERLWSNFGGTDLWEHYRAERPKFTLYDGGG